MNSDDRKWEILHTEYLIRRPWLTARRDHIRMPNGVENKEYYVLEYPDWVNVIAITRDGKFLMERQYRHGLQWTGYEICAGVCDAGETPLESARRELYEEINAFLKENGLTKVKLIEAGYAALRERTKE